MKGLEEEAEKARQAAEQQRQQQMEIKSYTSTGYNPTNKIDLRPVDEGTEGTYNPTGR